MAKIVQFDYVRKQNGQVLALELHDYSAVVLALIKFRGARRAIYGPEQRSVVTNTGTSSVTIPEVPAGYSFESHGAVAFVTVVNNTAATIQASIILSAPWGNYSDYKTIIPGQSITLSAGGGSYGYYSGNSVSLNVIAGGGEITYQGVAADTIGVRRPIIGYDQTENPQVSISENAAQHLGELADSVESEWLHLGGLTVGVNNLSVSVAGSNQVDIMAEATVEPLLSSPQSVNPEHEARIAVRKPWFEFVLPDDADNSATHYHARARISDVSTMNNSAVLESSQETGEWQYWTGSTWQAFPVEGVAPGTMVRVRPTQELNYKTYYWDCAAHDDYSYGHNSPSHSFRVMVAVTNLFSVVHKNEELQRVIGLSVTETVNGEIGEFSITLRNRAGEANSLINYGDLIILAINDSWGNTEEFHGIARSKQPTGPQRLTIIAKTGDSILAERIVKQDYPAQDIGLTVKYMIETYCQPLTASNVNTNTGIIAPVQSMGNNALSVMESIRQDHGALYYTDKDQDLHFFMEDQIEDAIVQIQYGDIQEEVV